MFFRLSMLKPLIMDTVSSFLASRGVPHVAVAAEVIPDTIDVDGKQRPTRNSEGRLIHPTLEGIRNFWKWFGDSKIVDEQGCPVTVYHGTGADIGAIDKSKFGQGNDSLGHGFYMTTSKDHASGYAKDSKDGSPNVSAYYARIEKPIVDKRLTTLQLRKLAEASPVLDDALWNFGDVGTYGKDRVLADAIRTLQDAIKNKSMLQILRILHNDLYNGASEEFYLNLKRILGYDGVIVEQADGSRECVVWEPEQIKSAIGNRGTFDPHEAAVTASEEIPETIPVGRKQRPTKTAAGKLISPTLEGIQNFWKWFGDSKFVDASGHPRIAYHGTNSDFSIFDKKKKIGSGPSKFGFWFADDPKFVDIFGSTLMPSFLRMLTPKKISHDKWNDIRERHAKDGAWFHAWREQIVAQGHDSLWIVSSNEQIGKFSVRNPDIIAVIEPTQIKSASGNRGTFSPTDSEITASA